MEATRTHAERLASRDGYFAPESVIRRVANTALVPLLGAGATVLLQVAHPLVAVGVVEHSDFRRDLWRRLSRTMHALYYIVFGTTEEAERAGRAVQAVHARVQGTTRSRLGPFPPGTPYSASDPQLMLWVHATLVETALGAYTRFVGPLAGDEQERFYGEMKVVGRIFGLAPSFVPPTLTDFRDHLRTMLEGPEIQVTEPAREVAAVILHPPLPAPLRLLTPAHRLATSVLLPPRLRDEYGLRWSRPREATLSIAARAVDAAAAPLFKAAERVSPAARVAA